MNGNWGASLQFPTKLRMPEGVPGSQSVGAKLHWTRGKQPRPQTKVPKFVLSVKGGRTAYTTRRLA